MTSSTGTAKVIEGARTETKIIDIKTKINEIEAVLQNHYQALILLLEKHDLVDSNVNDGSNVSTQ